MNRKLYPLRLHPIQPQQCKQIDEAGRPIAEAEPTVVVQQGKSRGQKVAQPISVPLSCPPGILPCGGLRIIGRVHGDQIESTAAQGLWSVTYIQFLKGDLLTVFFCG